MLTVMVFEALSSLFLASIMTSVTEKPQKLKQRKMTQRAYTAKICIYDSPKMYLKLEIGHPDGEEEV